MMVYSEWTQKRLFEYVTTALRNLTKDEPDDNLEELAERPETGPRP